MSELNIEATLEATLVLTRAVRRLFFNCVNRSD